MSLDLKPQSRLHGKTVFLSASVPTRERANEYDRILEAPLRIEEAVVCIARAIFIEGGTLVLGAHPSISPLVARVVDNYYLPAPAEETLAPVERDQSDAKWRNPSVLIYQSLVWEEFWAEATEQLSRHPLVNVKWTESEPGEFVDPTVKDRSQAPNSMERMRRSMIAETSPLAMVAIGGMAGVRNEAALFGEICPGKPIFAFATTGGASALLSGDKAIARQVRVIDSEADSLVRRFWAEQQKDEQLTRSTEAESRQFYVPYALVAQQIVAELAASGSTRP